MITKLSDLSYYKTGTTFDALYMPETTVELRELIAGLHRNQNQFILLGAGSNSLLMDDHWPGTVISLAKMKSISFIEKNVIEIQAGTENSSIAQFCADNALDGASWLYRLPGQLGGTIRMNARCYGGELKDIVHEVHAISPEGLTITFKCSEVFTGYKQTIFQQNNHVIYSAALRLQPGDPAAIKLAMQQHAQDREAKKQFLHPSCGCVFKNDYVVSVPSGKLLEAAGAQNLQSDRAMVSPYHANFVFNLGGASSREILELTFKMRQAVFDRFGVWLEYEMQLLGLIPEDLAALFNKKRTPCYKESDIAALRRPLQC